MPTPYSQWSIGIYTGESPLALAPHPAISNPVLCSQDVTDVCANFVADPFMMQVDDTWYMFFEVWNRDANKGEIGLATSPDGLHWSYDQIVLRQPYHLSYPYVFVWQDECYMIPETVADGTIQLYRAADFPTQWTPVTTLMAIEGTDASILYRDGVWWLFVCTTPYTQETLRLYMANALEGPWREHPCNPIIDADVHSARPAGRVVALGDRVIRYAQDCYPEYGTRVTAFEISTLSPTVYIEGACHQSPILQAGPAEWHRRRMHHVDPHLMPDGSWMACVDGDATAKTETEIILET